MNEPTPTVQQLEAEVAAMRKAISSAHYALEQSANKLRQVGPHLRGGVELTRLASRTHEVARELEAFLPAYKNTHNQQATN